MSLYIRFASIIRDGSEYFVLLIITDGIITDLPQATAAIVNVSLSTRYILKILF